MASDQSESGKDIGFECMIQVTEVKSRLSGSHRPAVLHLY